MVPCLKGCVNHGVWPTATEMRCRLVQSDLWPPGSCSTQPSPVQTVRHLQASVKPCHPLRKLKLAGCLPNSDLYKAEIAGSWALWLFAVA